MSARHRITVEVEDKLAFVRGWRASNLLKEAGTKPIYATSHGAYMIDAHRLPDVLAYLQLRNIAVTVVDDEVVS